MKIFVRERPWALYPEILHTLDALGVVARMEAVQPRPPSGSSTAVAVLPLHGVIMQRFPYFGTSVELFTQDFRRAMADPQVSSIVIDVDSPGGEVSGVPELAAEIMAARNEKKSTAVVNSFAASAAYWIASAASEIVASPSAMAGSIGVYALHMDFSKAAEMAGVKPTFISAGKFKVEGNELQPISEAAVAAIQDDVDAFYAMFVRDVARGRGVSMKAVREGFGEGRMVMASKALDLGMVDRIATLDETIARLAKSAARGATRACVPCGGCGRTVAMTDGEPQITREECPACEGEGFVLLAAAAEAPPIPGEPTAEDLARLQGRHENARARARALELA